LELAAYNLRFLLNFATKTDYSRPMISKAHLPEEDLLAKAMASKSALPIGAELEKLLIAWLTISSVNQPGQANALRFPFLKWALHGRAKDAVNYLGKSKNPKTPAVLEEIMRISNLPFPPKNEKARAAAMDIWAWLKQELHGTVE
jgi:hypothetical protein